LEIFGYKVGIEKERKLESILISIFIGNAKRRKMRVFLLWKKPKDFMIWPAVLYYITTSLTKVYSIQPNL
jgi:hypothetical protein